MRFLNTRQSFAKKLGLLGLLSLGLVQGGCAHQVWVEPSVVVSSRLGQVPVTVQVGVPGVVVMPQPYGVYAAPPPRVVYAPPVYTAPVYAYPPAWVYAERREAWGAPPPARHWHRHWAERGQDRDHDHFWQRR